MIFIKPSQLNLKVYIFNFFKKNYHEAIRLLSSFEIVYEKYKLLIYQSMKNVMILMLKKD